MTHVYKTNEHAAIGRNDYGTPWPLFKRLDDEFHFTRDVCAGAENAKCERFFSTMRDGLVQDWTHDICWMNPPYSTNDGKKVLHLWAEKAYRAAQAGATVVSILPAAVDTRWWWDWVLRADEIWFMKGRVTFEGADHGATFPTAIVIWRQDMLNRESPRIKWWNWRTEINGAEKVAT